MAKKEDPKKQEEEKTNDGQDNNGRDPGGKDGGKDGERGESESGAPSGESGGESGTSGGQSDGGEPSGGESGGGGGESEPSPRENRKVDILQRVRSKRSHGLGNASRDENGTSHGDSKGNARNVLGDKRGVKSDNGATPRANSGSGRGERQDSNGNGGASETPQGNERTQRVKPTGVNIKGVDKIKQLAAQAATVDAPKTRFQWDDKPLSNKEADELLPKVRGLLEFLFRHIDKGLSISNRNRAEAHVWSNIDEEDIDIIAGHLVEMAKGSKVVATAVRRMSASYRMLQIGLITFPKFVQTYQFYMANGGFALMPPK